MFSRRVLFRNAATRTTKFSKTISIPTLIKTTVFIKIVLSSLCVPKLIVILVLSDAELDNVKFLFIVLKLFLIEANSTSGEIYKQWSKSQRYAPLSAIKKKYKILFYLKKNEFTRKDKKNNNNNTQVKLNHSQYSSLDNYKISCVCYNQRIPYL